MPRKLPKIFSVARTSHEDNIKKLRDDKRRILMALRKQTDKIEQLKEKLRRKGASEEKEQNVFLTENDVLRNKSKANKKSPLKFKKVVVDKDKRVFDKIYNEDDIFRENIHKVKLNKEDNLFKYQNKLMSLMSGRVSDDAMRQLSESLKGIRELNVKHEETKYKLDFTYLKKMEDTILEMHELGISDYVIHEEKEELPKKKSQAERKNKNLQKILHILPEFLHEKFINIFSRF